MRFPNAARGVKQLYIAQMLSILAAIVAIVTSGMITAGSEGTEGLLVGLGLGSGVLALVAFVLNLLGLNAARKDDGFFQTAFVITLIGIVVSLFGAAVQGNALVNGLCNAASNVCNALITYFVVKGIISLAEQLGKENMTARGKRLLGLVITTWIVVIVLQIIGAFFSNNDTMAAIGAILALIAALAAIVAFILYLSYLSKARIMLEA